LVIIKQRNFAAKISLNLQQRLKLIEIQAKEKEKTKNLDKKYFLQVQKRQTTFF